MAWRRVWDDRMVEVIVDPQFSGDLIELAKLHPVWVLETPHNKPLIDAAWKVGAELGLCAINRCPVRDGGVDPAEDFLGLFPTVHIHHNYTPPRYVGAVVHGTSATEEIRRELEEAGFSITDTGESQFTFSVPRREN